MQLVKQVPRSTNMYVQHLEIICGSGMFFEFSKIKIKPILLCVFQFDQTAALSYFECGFFDSFYFR